MSLSGSRFHPISPEDLENEEEEEEESPLQPKIEQPQPVALLRPGTPIPRSVMPTPKA